MADYYKVDSRKITFREHWRMAGGKGFLVAAVLKVLRIPLDFHVALPAARELVRFDEAELPGESRERMGPALQACESEGLLPRFFYDEPVLNPEGRTRAAACLDPEGRRVAFVADYEDFSEAEHHVTVLSLVTRIRGRRYWETTTAEKKFDPPPGDPVETIRLPKASHAELFARHRARLDADRRDSVEAVAESELEDLILENSARRIEFNKARGVYVPMSDAEVARAFCKRGEAYRHHGEAGPAIADFDQAVRYDPSLAEAYLGRGQAYFDRGETELAIEDYDQAIHLEPEAAEAEVYLGRGRAFLALGDERRARSDFSSALELAEDPAVEEEAREGLRRLRDPKGA